MNASANSITSSLSQIVGSSHAVTDPVELSPYSIGAQLPGAAVRPGSSAEVVEIVKFAAGERLAIVPMAARTKLSVGMPPTRYGLALDLSRLDRVIAYDPNDLTLGVEPGIPLTRLASVLAGHKQFLPLTVPWMNRATVGGTIASGVDSPLRQLYGTARDYILGIEFVTGDGRLVKSGGSVVKNVSGYDIHKLLIGSLGTLGVITRINFRTFPVRESMRVFVAVAETAADAIDLCNRVAQSALRSLTLDIVGPLASLFFSRDVVEHIDPGPTVASLSTAHWAIVVSFAGKQEALDRYHRDLQQLVEPRAPGRPSALDSVVFGGDTAAGVLERVREFVTIALESSEAATIVKLSVLPGHMTRLAGDVECALRESDLPWAAMLRGVGVIYFALLPKVLDETARNVVVQTTERILAFCTAVGGNASVPWCPHEWKSSLSVWGKSTGDIEQARKLKKVFDPPGILAPGRFAGGF
jgi:glycolate oxidase FAD binding subunit